MSEIVVSLPDEAATLALAAKLAGKLTAGASVHLRGELGAGKTSFIRGVLRTLGHRGAIKSPTYPILETYDLAGFELNHFDFYRLQHPHAWREAGFADCFKNQSVCMIEWPEKAEGLPAPELIIELAFDGEGRTARVSGPQCEWLS